MNRFLTTLLLSAALAGSIPVRADDQHSDKQTKRYYDKSGGDYHEWSPNEDRAYHQYVSENHKKDREFAKTSSREKDDYFKWRHSHPDQDKH
jgi:hypothetical protein